MVMTTRKEERIERLLKYAASSKGSYDDREPPAEGSERPPQKSVLGSLLSGQARAPVSAPAAAVAWAPESAPVAEEPWAPVGGGTAAEVEAEAEAAAAAALAAVAAQEAAAERAVAETAAAEAAAAMRPTK
mmetsp:Transcript_26269/g.69684  ORF Transcript_26269/g.69684 Transcript_26269/m.69684 type:complete len:131 (+) Transcript_26269:654-1046(+)